MLSQASVAKKITLTLLALLAVLALVASAVLIVQKDDSASAVKASDFNPGRIIDDAVFYNAGAMTAGQIQTFLNSKNTQCDTNGTGRATDWGRPDITRATLASYIRNGTHGYNKNTNFHAPPYTCLKDFKQDTPQVAAASGLCEAIPARSNRTAAQIIHDVAQACGINPQVFLVLLEKEQSLVTDIWPLNLQYQRATGFACPDNVGGACDPSFNGFFRQVYAAGRQFKLYQSRPNDYNYRAGVTNNIFWQTNGGNFVSDGRAASRRNGQCGYSRVYIENQATAALYIYTPYRPNQAAMANFPGTGDACSAYGNRNFWFMFNGWFGSTNSIQYIPLKTPRYLEVSANTSKTSLHDFDKDGTSVSRGQIIYFSSKVRINGVEYLRTRHDTRKDIDYGIPFDDLNEISIDFEPMTTPRYMKVSQDTYKKDPRTESDLPIQMKRGEDILLTHKFNIGNTTYLQSLEDNTHNAGYGTPINNLQEIETIDMISPRYLRAPQDTQYQSFHDLSSTGDPLNQNEVLLFTKKRIIDGITYLQSHDDLNIGNRRGIKFDTLENISIEFRQMKTPRYLRIPKDMQKTDLRNGGKVGSTITEGRDVYFVDTYTFMGVQYLRTELDSRNGSLRAIPFEDLDEIDVVDMVRPRTMKVSKDLYKQSFHDLSTSGSVIRQGRLVSFVSKATINGNVYLRTELDTANGQHRGIPYSDLIDL